MSEWLKVPDSKSGVVTSHRGFESHPLRHKMKSQVAFFGARLLLYKKNPPTACRGIFHCERVLVQFDLLGSGYVFEVVFTAGNLIFNDIRLNGADINCRFLVRLVDVDCDSLSLLNVHLI